MKGMLKTGSETLKKIALILLCSAVVTSAGTAVAYYNTASIGYDSANIVSFYEGGVYLLDFDINYEKTKKDFSALKKYAPAIFVSI